jgi:MFS family permease
MGLVAFLAHNVFIGTIFGTSGVFLRPIAEHLGVTLELASVGMPMVMIGSAVLSSLAGVLAARYSLKLLLFVSAFACSAGWALLGFTSSYAVYLLVYGLLLGPAMAVGGTVLPPTLITRWFSRNRGLAIGIAHISLVITIMPLASNWLVESYGISAAFLALAAFVLLTLIPAAIMLREHPPGADAQTAATQAAPSGMSMGQLAGSAKFWLLVLGVASANTGSVLLGVHLVTMAETWGFTRTQGAGLASVMSFAGMLGFIVFGWVSDKIGGARTIGLIAFDLAVLWAMLLMRLPYPGLLVLIGLIGMHGAGTIPAVSKAFASEFGEASFSRAFGLAATVQLPFMIVGVIGTGAAATNLGGYAVPIFGMMALHVVALVSALVAGRPDGQAAVAA